VQTVAVKPEEKMPIDEAASVNSVLPDYGSKQPKKEKKSIDKNGVQ
jgi:hypothetical protein